MKKLSLLVLSSSLMKSGVAYNEKNTYFGKTVIVIGGGISGLTAAKKI